MHTTTAHKRAFVARLKAEGVPVARAHVILRAADTLQRIAADDCSNEAAYLLMERHRARCPDCARDAPNDRTYVLAEASMLGSVRGLCPEHKAERALRAAVAGTPIVALDLNGDPRGAVVKLKLPSGRGDSFGDPSFLCVPTREY